jgi:hypothetical protein
MLTYLLDYKYVMCHHESPYRMSAEFYGHESAMLFSENFTRRVNFTLFTSHDRKKCNAKQKSSAIRNKSYCNAV